MSKFIDNICRIAYYPLSPFVSVALHNSRRVRVLVISSSNILLLRTRLGHQKWSTPGGGVNKNENPIDAAVRELYEETGIKVKPDMLNFIGEKRLPENKLWPRYDAMFYVVKLSTTQKTNTHSKYEIIDTKWFKISELPDRLGLSVTESLKLYNKSAK